AIFGNQGVQGAAHAQAGQSTTEQAFPTQQVGYTVCDVINLTAEQAAQHATSEFFIGAQQVGHQRSKQATKILGHAFQSAVQLVQTIGLVPTESATEQGSGRIIESVGQIVSSTNRRCQPAAPILIQAKDVTQNRQDACQHGIGGIQQAAVGIGIGVCISVGIGIRIRIRIRIRIGISIGTGVVIALGIGICNCIVVDIGLIIPSMLDIGMRMAKRIGGVSSFSSGH